jgi:N-acetylglucosamine kinase-like BadF-type ATPase
VTARAPAAVLAIDGGNSKTDVAVLDADGTLLALTRGPGSNAQVIGLDAALAVIDQLVANARRDAGLSDAGRLATHTAAYLAGIDVPQEETVMRAALSARRWSTSFAVDNDTFAVFRAGASEHWGVGVVAGAGINAVGIAPDGRTARFLSINETTGDFGGGGGLSRQVMWHAIRAEDGRGEPTSLQPAVTAHFGLPSVRDVAIALHLGELSEADLLGLTPVLFREAGLGDAIAHSLLDRQAREVALLARSAMRQLDLHDTPTQVVLGGGVLTARDPLLLKLIEQWMAREAPRGVVRVNDLPAIAGAALLGLDHLGGSPEAEQRVRDALRER